ncbi:MAG: phosphoribosyltransferase family protein [bacterium]
MNEVLDILKKVGAVVSDSHFVGTSGRHMSVYVSKDKLLPHTQETFRVTQLMADMFKNLDVDVVAAPVVGGVILGNLVAYHLSVLQKKEILSVYAEKTPEGPMTFKRDYDKLVKGKKVLIIDDVVATGFSVHKMIEVVKAFGGNIVSMGVIANRVPEEVNTKTLGLPLSWLCEIPAETYDEKDCPLCKKGVPINITLGHGKKFLEVR